jgi:hypothetical protein
MKTSKGLAFLLLKARCPDLPRDVLRYMLDRYCSAPEAPPPPGWVVEKTFDSSTCIRGEWDNYYSVTWDGNSGNVEIYINGYVAMPCCICGRLLQPTIPRSYIRRTCGDCASAMASFFRKVNTHK